MKNNSILISNYESVHILSVREDNNDKDFKKKK